MERLHDGSPSLRLSLGRGRGNLLLWQLLLRLGAGGNPSGDGGFTLIESLLAIVVVGILLVATAPMMAVTVAARVNARRIDLATQATRAYIDSVRAGVIAPPNKTIASSSTTFSSVASPVNTYLTSPDEGVLVDTNGDGFRTDDPQDIVLQAIRTPVTCNVAADPNCPTTEGFTMLVRAYRADAFEGGSSPNARKTNCPASAPNCDIYATGLGAQGSAFVGGIGPRQSPLTVVTTEITNNESTTYTDYCTRLGGC